MNNSQSLYEQSKHLFPGGVNSPVRRYDPYPNFMKSGTGSRIVDADGKGYLDYCLAFGPLILGHSNRAVKDAIVRQLENAAITGAPSENELALALKIRKAVPSIEMMRFANTGSEAVFHSLRLARAYTRKTKILKFSGSYHGAHDYNLVRTDSRGVSIPSSEGVPDQIAETVVVSEYGDIEMLRKIFRENAIAAAIVEPVMANAGLIKPDPEFLRALREITEENGSLLIFDEVVTGFRSRFGCYHDSIGIVPDLVTMSKIIGGGMPLSVFGGKKEVMEMVAPSGKVYVAGTFSGNPVSTAAGLATLNELEHKDYRLLNRYVEEVTDSIQSSIENNGANAVANSFGSMFQVFFTSRVDSYRDALTSNTEHYGKLFRHMLSESIYLPSSQFETLFVSFEHSDEDLAKTTRSFEDFFGKVLK